MKRIRKDPFTTWAGLALSAFLGFVLFAPELFPPWLLALAKYAAIGGTAGLGIWARDPR